MHNRHFYPGTAKSGFAACERAAAAVPIPPTDRVRRSVKRPPGCRARRQLGKLGRFAFFETRSHGLERSEPRWKPVQEPQSCRKARKRRHSMLDVGLLDRACMAKEAGAEYPRRPENAYRPKLSISASRGDVWGMAKRRSECNQGFRACCSLPASLLMCQLGFATHSTSVQHQPCV